MKTYVHGRLDGSLHESFRGSYFHGSLDGSWKLSWQASTEASVEVAWELPWKLPWKLPPPCKLPWKLLRRWKLPWKLSALLWKCGSFHGSFHRIPRKKTIVHQTQPAAAKKRTRSVVMRPFFASRQKSLFITGRTSIGCQKYKSKQFSVPGMFSCLFVYLFV